MGLTFHYKLNASGTDAQARKIIESLHQQAHDLPFKEVGDIVDLSGSACDFNRHDRDNPLRWLLIQSQGNINLSPPGSQEYNSMGVSPTRMIAFSTWPGDGCEQANFGLCQYPVSVKHQGNTIPTKLSGWRWSSFCKTQYASDPACGGLGNFLRCHLAIVALLDKAKALACLGEVHDESHFWEHRDVQKLIPNLASWNSMIAAFAGQLKDTLGKGVQSAISEFPNFEQLELEGQSQLTPETLKLAKLIGQVAKKPQA